MEVEALLKEEIKGRIDKETYYQETESNPYFPMKWRLKKTSLNRLKKWPA